MPCIQTSVINKQPIIEGILVLAPGEWNKKSVIKDNNILVTDAHINSCNGLIDTGATGSCISERVAENLGLQPRTKGQVRGVGGLVDANLYDADIIFLALSRSLNSITLTGFPVAENSKYDIIISMDIISLGSLHLNFGLGNEPPRVTFCW